MTGRTLAVFPADAGALLHPWSANAARYRNRADLFELFHIEARGDGVGPIAFTARTVAGDDEGDRPHLACRVDHAGDFFRLCASFPTQDLELGELIHLQWVVRVSPFGEEDDEQGVQELLLACDGSRAGKRTAATLTVGHEPGEWSRAEALLYVAKTSEQGLLHLGFIMPSKVQVDVAGLRAVVLGRIEPDPATISEAKIGQARLVRRPEVSPVLPDEPLFRDSETLGFVTALRPDRVRGWALRPADLAASPQVDILVDGAPTGGFSVAPPSADVQSLAASGFDVRLPPEVADGGEHQVELKFPGGEPLRRSPGAVRLTHRVEGLIQYDEATASAVGWAVDLADAEQPPWVEVLADGELLGRVRADRHHPVLTTEPYRRGKCGFRLPLPPEVGRKSEVVLTARLESGEALPGGPVRLLRTGPRYESELLPHGADELKGWIRDRLRPGAPVRIKLQVDGLPLRTLEASEATDTSGQVGFRFAAPPGARSVVLTAGEEAELLGLFALRPEGVVRLDPAAVPVDVPTTAVGIVDPEWYAAQRQGLAPADAGKHWLEVGGPAGLSPTPWFDEAWYRRENPDVDAAVTSGRLHSGFVHWLERGGDEGRRPGPAVEPSFVAPSQAIGEALSILRGASPGPATAAAAAARPRGPRLRRVAFGEERPDLAAALQPRAKGRSTVFDALVDNLLRDLRLTDRRKAAGLQEELALSETEIFRRLWADPVEGSPLISVVMPTFNRAFVIAEAIQSVLDQSWPHWELLVCDDGSTDRTPHVVAGFADPRIRYLKLEKRNGASARNYGLKFARGEFIAFLDSDNVWHPNFLQLVLGALQRRRGVDLVYTGFLDTQITGARYADGAVAFRAFDYPALLGRNFIDLNTLFVRRTLYEDLGGFDADLPRVQDWDLVLKYAQFAEPAAIRAYPAFYRRNPAWGQVTDLYAHLNFNQIVRERAAERLARGQPPLRRGLGRRAALTVLAGASEDDAADAIGFALAAAEIADVRLQAPETPVARALAAGSALSAAVDVVWTERPDPSRLWGEAVVLADSKSTLDGRALARGAPFGRLLRFEDVARLELDGDALDLALLGGLWPLAEEPDVTNPEAEESDAAVALDAKLRAFIVDAADAPAWDMALAERGAEQGATLLIPVGETAEPARLLDRDGPRTLDILEASRLLGEGAGALVLTAMHGAALAERLCIGPAIAGGALLLSVEQAGRAGWLRDRAALPLASSSPSDVLAAVTETLADTPLADRTRAFARARHRRLHRRAAVRERLRHVLTRWLTPQAVDA